MTTNYFTKKISYNDLIRILKEKDCCTSDLRVLNDYINGRDVIDISGTSGNTTFIIPKNEKNKESFVVKISPNDGELYDEYIVNNLFFKYNLAPEVIEYFSSNKDYLINRFIEGNCAINLINDVEEMAVILGKSLRLFHDMKWDKDNFDFMESEVIIDNPDKFLNISMEHNFGNNDMKEYLKENNFNRMKEYILENGYLYKNDDVIVHGEFNPKNIFLKDKKLFNLMGFSDTHYGDRHLDIFYAKYALHYYYNVLYDTKLIDRIDQLFLDSYGRDAIDYERLRLCGYIMCMYKEDKAFTRELKL